MHSFPGRAVLSALVVSAALASPVLAADTGGAAITMDSLKQMLTNMGYPPETSGSDIDIHISQNGDHYVYFDFSKDGSVLYADLSFDDYSADQAKKLDLMGLLKANDANRAYFSIEQNNGKTQLYLTVNEAATNVTPVVLRGLIDGLLDTESDTDSLWDIWDSK